MPPVRQPADDLPQLYQPFRLRSDRLVPRIRHPKNNPMKKGTLLFHPVRATLGRACLVRGRKGECPLCARLRVLEIDWFCWDLDHDLVATQEPRSEGAVVDGEHRFAEHLAGRFFVAQSSTSGHRGHHQKQLSNGYSSICRLGFDLEPGQRRDQAVTADPGPEADADQEVVAALPFAVAEDGACRPAPDRDPLQTRLNGEDAFCLLFVKVGSAGVPGRTNLFKSLNNIDFTA